MGTKELMRVKVLEMVRQGKITLKEGGVKLKISYRQAKRLYKRYKEEGDKGIVHRNQGRVSNRKIGGEVRERVIKAYKERYNDFGPTFASEKLEEQEGIKVDHETLRRWLLEEGLWERKRRSKKYRSRRERRERFGELLQFDGSHHDWFEGRRGKCCLMNMVDDATGKTLAILYEEETTAAAMELLWRWIKTYGIPQAVYCDRKNAFVLNKEPTLEEQLKGIESKSPFELACERLGIEVLVAYSPQAKGRVERNHGIYQDRFVKELRLRNICTLEEANKYLEKEYLPLINNKFGLEPKEPEDAHVPLLNTPDLSDIFCFESSRVVSNDFVIRFEKHLYQIDRNNLPRPRPGDRVTIRRWLDGSVHFYWKDKPLLVQEINSLIKKEAKPCIPA